LVAIAEAFLLLLLLLVTPSEEEGYRDTPAAKSREEEEEEVDLVKTPLAMLGMLDWVAPGTNP
jgi:hypothetical protein